MNATIEEDPLPAIGLLESLPEATRRDLAAIGSLQTVAPNTKIARQGVRHETLWIVVSGHLSVTCHAHGDFVHLAALGPGDTIGEMSLLDDYPSSADVTVIRHPARLWCVQSKHFHRFLENDRNRGYDIIFALGCKLSQRLRQNSEHMLAQAESLRSHFLDIDY